MAEVPFKFESSTDNGSRIIFEFVGRDAWKICSPDFDICFLLDSLGSEDELKDLTSTVRENYYGVDDAINDLYYEISVERVKQLNSEFKLYGQYGYSIGSFHEVFVEEPIPYLEFNLADAEVKLGEASPFCQILFSSAYISHYHREWGEIKSLKFIGVKQEDFETYLLNALIYIQKVTGFKVEFYSFEFDEEQEAIWAKFHDKAPNYVKISEKPQVYKDVEILRLYHYALTSKDNIAACIYFHRVVEFYAFVRKHSEIDRVRRDGAIDSKKFAKEIQKMIKASEGENIYSLIQEVVTSSILDFAYTYQLVDSKDAKKFAKNLYEFRNSIIHAKSEHNSIFITDSVLNPSSEVALWREVFSRLVPEILNKFGL